MKTIIQAILPLGIGVLCMAEAAKAQEISGEQEVPRLTAGIRKISPRPEPEAAVTIGWEGEAGVKYIDNIYRAPTNEKSDEAAVIAPGFVVRSHLDRHAYAVKGNLEHG